MIMKISRKRIITISLLAIILILLIGTVLGLVIFKRNITYYRDLNVVETNTYERLYVLISDDTDSTLWNSIYEELLKVGPEKGVYVQNANQKFSSDYSKAELMEIAINEKVDGIILEGDEDEEIRELVNLAHEKGIPVITVYSDVTDSYRESYVGINNYNLGIEYGKLISSAAREILYKRTTEMTSDQVSVNPEVKVCIMMDNDKSSTLQNILYSAMQSVTDNDGSSGARIALETVVISGEDTFSVEESVQEFFHVEQETPDIVVCLNELNTRSVYQAVVDKNAVGKIIIIGYYDSDTILRGIERQAIYATITVDTHQVAQYAIDALNEFYEMGRVSEYFGVDYTMINARNVEEFLQPDVEED